jgi:RNA polymerase primary sigma factor
LNNLKSYLDSISSYEKLDNSANENLIEQLKSLKDKIVKGNLKNVVVIATEMNKTWPDFDIMDYIQEGNETLMRIIEKFDSSKDIKFSTFLSFCVKNDIFRFIKLNTGPVSLYNTRNQRKVFSQLSDIKADFKENNISMSELEDKYDIPREDILSVIGGTEHVDVATIAQESLEDTFIKREAKDALIDKTLSFRKMLNQQELVIFDEHLYGGDMSLQDIADYFGTTRQYIWKIKTQLLDKARSYFSIDDLNSIT